MRKVIVTEVTHADGSVQFKVSGTSAELEPPKDLMVLIEGLALMTHITSKYMEENISKTQQNVLERIKEAFARHDKFAFIKNDQNLQQPKDWRIGC